MKGLLLTLLAASLALCSCVAQARLPDGRPPVRAFQPDLDVYPQNFSIAVDDRSRVFVGNTDGVLIFDGAYWQLVPLDNRDIVRSLALGPGGRVYVGGYDGFGYIEQTATGEFVYRELSGLFAAELGDDRFADIWRIEVTPEAVYFVALKHLFRYAPDAGATELLVHEGSFGPMAWFDGRALLQFRGEGIKAYDNGTWRLIDDGKLAASFLEAMAVLDDETLVLVSSDSTWHRYDGRTVTAMPEADALPYKGSVTAAQAAGNGTLALATQLGKVMFYVPETGAVDVIDVSVGFVSDIARTRAGQMLFVDDQGFSSVTWPAPWRAITEGLAGSVHAFGMLGEDAYALTSSGAFVARSDADAFERLPWTDYEAWDLLALDDGSVLFADSYAIKHIDAAGRIKIVDDSTTARVFQRAASDPDRVYVGTEFGLQVLERTDAGWQSVVQFDELDALRITEIIETSPGELWVGSERGGIRRLRLRSEPTWALEQRVYDTADGLSYGNISHGAHLYRHAGSLLATTEAGLFRLTDGRFEPTQLDGLAEVLPAGQTAQLAASDSEQWAFTYSGLFRRNGAWREQEVAAIKRGAFTTIRFLDDRAVVGNLGALLVFDAKAMPPSAEPTPVGLSSAILSRQAAGPDEESVRTSLPLDDIRVPSGSSRLTLRFVLTDLDSPDAVAYRTRLMPVEPNFSPWSGDSQQSFVALSAGTYEFEVQARDSLGRITQLRVPIDVQPRWHELPGLNALLALTALLVVYRGTLLLGRRRARSLTRERDRLELMVAERTEALRAANEQLDQLAHLDGLTNIPNRRRLDAYLADVWQQSIDRQRPLAVALLDVDHFKRYNDTHGHQAGDVLLKALAELFTQHLRRTEDLVARYGGEEFLVVLPGADADTARSIIEDMRLAVADSSLGVTVSAGLQAEVPDAASSVEAMIAAADEALYRAKDGGRNQVALA